MKRQQLGLLFICNLVPSTIGIAIISLLPVYAVKLGASEIVTGIFIGMAFGALAVGTLMSGWLSDRFQRRKLTIMLAGVLGVPATFLMGQVDKIVWLAVSTIVVWFVAGVTVTTINILVGIYTEPEARGKTYGIIGATVGLGQILGGFGSGAIVDRWGFPALFSLLALVWTIQIISILFLSDPIKTYDQVDQVEGKAFSLQHVIWFLTVAHLLAAITDSSAGLGRPLLMDNLGFSASSISGAIAVTGFVTLPLPILAGWLSDRFGRPRLILLCYLAVATGVFMLSTAISVWQFWLSTVLISVTMPALSVGLALVNDLASSRTRASAVSRFSAIPWIAGIMGFGGTGFVINVFGLQTTFTTMTILPLISVLLMILVDRSIHRALVTEGDFSQPAVEDFPAKTMA